MDRETSSHELGRTRGRTAETQARGMESTSTTMPPAHGLSTGTTKNDRRRQRQAAAAIRLRSAAQAEPPSPDSSDDSENFIDEEMAGAQERVIFFKWGSSGWSSGCPRLFYWTNARTGIGPGGGFNGRKNSRKRSSGETATIKFY